MSEALAHAVGAEPGLRAQAVCCPALPEMSGQMCLGGTLVQSWGRCPAEGGAPQSPEEGGRASCHATRPRSSFCQEMLLYTQASW